jgi:hypothetical protein
VGPSFGTLGSTANLMLAGGYQTYPWMSFGVEFGALPRADFDKARPILPGVSVPASALSDARVNKYHVNGNLFVQSPWTGRFTPYGTVGVGAVTGSAVTEGAAASALASEDRRRTNPAVNLGSGATFRVARWFGLTADYRHFIVMAQTVNHVNRFTAGVTIFNR